MPPALRITAAMCAWGRAIGDPRLSPDGRSLAFVCAWAGRTYLSVTDVEGGPETILTSDPAPAGIHGMSGGVFDWFPDGDHLVYVGSDGGLYRVEAGGGPALALAGTEQASCPAVSPDGRWVAYVVDTLEVALVPTEATEVALVPTEATEVALVPTEAAGRDGSSRVRAAYAESGGHLPGSRPGFALDPSWAPDGTKLAWHQWDPPAMPWDSSHIVVADVAAGGSLHGLRVVAGGPGTSVGQPRFSPDGEHLAYVSDVGGWANVWVADPNGSQARPVVDEPFEHAEPTWGGGQRSFAWAPDATSVALARNEGGFGRLCVAGLEPGPVIELGRGVHGCLSWAGSRLAALRSGAATPTQVVTVEVAARQRRQVVRGPVGGFESAGLIEPESVEWEAEPVSLGGATTTTVHGRLYRARGENAAPLLVWVHGGPTGQMQVTFNARVAYFVERGWSVLAVDHRGSTGWGRAYTQVMAGRWGDLDVADTAQGMQAALDRGWADPGHMVAIGASSGGLTVLNLMARFPQLCAAGIDLYGVTDLEGLAASTHRFEAHYTDSLVGPLPGAASIYRERSPAHHAHFITSPLLILHGSNDQVVPVAQSRALAASIVAAGGEAELVVYEDEGHGWGKPSVVMDELARIEAFLSRFGDTSLKSPPD
ncbi:MAG: S9 family peptidase [Acidimicrobiales bacterium]